MSLSEKVFQGPKVVVNRFGWNLAQKLGVMRYFKSHFGSLLSLLVLELQGGSHFLPFEHQKSREEPGARLWSKLMLKLQPKIAKISLYSPAFSHNFDTYSTVYFSHPITKIRKIWLIMVYWMFGTKTSCPSKAMQNGILSIIQAINKPNCWQEALILYLVSENELSKPNQFRCLEIHRFLPLNWSKTGLWLAQTY